MFNNDVNPPIKISTILFKRTELFIKEIKFQWLLKKVESKNIYPALEHDNFAKIKGLQRLRNKLHLHLANSPEQSDYNSFSVTDINFANDVLLNVLDHYSTDDPLLSKLPFNDIIEM